jgi:ubiquinone/menaquinone biosynthesis C-methylase UbiE
VSRLVVRKGGKRVDTASRPQKKGYKGLPMEGIVARWYSRVRGSESQVDALREQAAELTETLPNGAAVLEVATGPGYFAIEMARLGRVRVTGLDISRTFVEIARENARQAGVSVDFKQGDAADMPFADGSFDLIVCQAAFKNFAQPGSALDEMHRILRDGGTAVIQDLSRDASATDISHQVKGMRLSRVNALMTRLALLTTLRWRAYTTERFRKLAAASAFGTCDIQTSGINIEIRLKKK